MITVATRYEVRCPFCGHWLGTFYGQMDRYTGKCGERSCKAMLDLTDLDRFVVT